MMYHGYGYGGGNHWGLWVLVIVALVVFWAALAWIIVTLVRHRGTPPVRSPRLPDRVRRDPVRTPFASSTSDWLGVTLRKMSTPAGGH